jgi:alpha-tubulin suppressor-like RCC1 family protein
MEIRQICANADITAAITKQGDLYTWGSVRNGSMLTPDGSAYQQNLDEPTLFNTREHSFSQCAVGKDHMAMLTDKGKLLTMGSIDHGKLGHKIEPKAKLSNMAKHQYKAKDTNSNAALGLVAGDLADKTVI